MSLESLYSETILDHYKHPRNLGEIPECTCSAEHESPLCGDQIRVWVDLRDGRVAEARFSGKGCAISQASASMMTVTMRGRSIEDARRTAAAFLAMMRGEREFEALDEAGELEALQGVLQFAARVKCATLAWDALAACLSANSGPEDGEGEGRDSPPR